MAYIKKGSDLITTMGLTENRLKKVERQLAVPRKGKSAASAEELFTGSGNTGVAVEVVLTANCLIHVYAQFDLKSSTAAANIDALFLLTGADASDFNSRVVVQYDGTCVAPTVYTSHTSTSRPRQLLVTQAAQERNQTLTFPNLRQPNNTGAVMAAGKYDAQLLFATTSGTLSIKNQFLFVSVQPF